MIAYLLAVNGCLVVCYGFYKVFLERETFFVLNRISLIGLAVLSFCLPGISANEHLSASIALDSVVQVGTLPRALPLWANQMSSWLERIYLAGVLLRISWLAIKLLYVKNTLRRPVRNLAFSFFTYKAIDPNIDDFSVIDYHEDVHIRQWHSLDILFFELVTIIAWFNPVVYLYQVSIKRVHEFLADRATARYIGDYHRYAQLLLKRAMSGSPHLTSSFTDKHLLKQRIFMLSKNSSPRISLLKYSLLIPVLLCTTSFSILISRTTGPAASSMESGNRAPAFPSSFNGFRQYLSHKISESAVFRAHHDQGKVLVSFVVDTDGSVVMPRVLASPDEALGQEAIAIIKQSPQWSPGYQNGQPVRVQYQIELGYQARIAN
ncbi:M56 family metallopeptidase [Spirosoma sp.]|uniref:M56 family metallopeptidase n=1 Tax=Spirosoma sp. TaxID=1899569 RepID=UPI002628C72E|nr:M56 family metallopeptidase [Spirosoma sp.]MCX6215807.1 M56 family metallopeptidase [Spirosoma sp.]